MAAAAAAAAAAGLALATPAATSLPYSTVAKAAMPGDGSERAYIALDRAAIARFAERLGPSDRARVAAVDRRRFALVAAFVTLPTPCHAYRIAGLARSRRALVVTVAVGAQRGECIQVIASAYHVVKVRRAALGSRPPTRAVLRVVARSQRYR